MKMKKITFALSIVLMLLMIFQIATMFMPYVSLSAPITTKDPDPGPQSYSLFDFCFFNTKAITSQYKTIDKNWDVNANVTSFAVTFGLAAIVFFFCLFTRKSLVSQIFALGYAVIAIYSFWFNPYLAECDYANVVTTSRVLTILSTLIILARLVLWFIIRYVTKGYSLMALEKEGELGLNPNATWSNIPMSAVWVAVVVGMVLVCLIAGFFVANKYHLENGTRTAEYKQNAVVQHEATIKDLNKQIKDLNKQIEELQEAATEETETEETVPEETVPEETVEETVPEETVAETTGETVPETTAAAA